jgi:nondiscriminating glutamyl-tRNA synthetase
MYDLEKLRWVNGQHLKKMDNEDIITMLSGMSEAGNFNKQDSAWKNTAVTLLKQYADFVSDIPKKAEEMIFGEHIEMKNELMEILGWETTPKIIDYLCGEMNKITTPFVTEAELTGWMDFAKKDLAIKGKPLFQGIRAALTGQEHGPDLKLLIPLTPVAIIRKRLGLLNKTRQEKDG